MKHEYLEAYEFYKRQYPNNVILFHIGCAYINFDMIANIGGNSITVCSRGWGRHWYCFHQKELEKILFTLRKRNIPVTVVEYRNEQGSFDIPKVKQILQDMEDDY